MRNSCLTGIVLFASLLGAPSCVNGSDGQSADDAFDEVMLAGDTDVPALDTERTQAGALEMGSGTKSAPNDAARSVIVVIRNDSSATLYLANENLAHGVWSENMYPPASIPSHATVRFASESQGFLTGTEGKASYLAFDQSHLPPYFGPVNLYWNNPFVGSNSHSVIVPWFLKFGSAGGSGNNATWTVTITNA